MNANTKIYLYFSDSIEIAISKDNEIIDKRQ